MPGITDWTSCNAHVYRAGQFLNVRALLSAVYGSELQGASAARS